MTGLIAGKNIVDSCLGSTGLCISNAGLEVFQQGDKRRVFGRVLG